MALAASRLCSLVAVFFWLLLALAVEAKDKKKSAKKCHGSYSTPVQNLCEKDIPADKVHLVLFYKPDSTGCQKVKPAVEKLAKKLSDDKSDSVIGAVDCAQYQDVCQKYGVYNFPTFKGFLAGKPKPYNGEKEVDDMKQFVEDLAKKQGSKGGSLKCEKGPFTSPAKDAVVPLCDAHFPDEGAKNPWLIAFYRMSDLDARDKINRISIDLGNEPEKKSKAQKKAKKQRERLKDLAEKYEFEVELPKKGPSATDALLKVGGVCCDCTKGPSKLCTDKEDGLYFVSKGKQQALKVENWDAAEGVKAALGMLGYVKGVEKNAEL
eukprot:TRINITY_DN59307_c0_g1_i1.p1 TRINITY_DN59307_c0_g1~~TRINITY_DN59307_c0_g1_i1.p1  ORF type:complete len:342 (+),score=89.83 TRINITY_DN59307_c0_g1_i1:64-1026(+)